MSTDPNPTPPVPSPAAHGRRFKRRELQLADGSTLVLNADGSITQVHGEGGAGGAPTEARGSTDTWQPTDPEWAIHAIRFGVFPQDATVAPTGRHVEGMRPPRR